MRTLILFIIAGCSLVSAHAQKIQFSNPSNNWSFVDSTVGCCIPQNTGYTHTRYDSTTIDVNGKTYQHILSSLGESYTREEAGRVYSLDLDSVERLTYDFNLGLGDTQLTVYPTDTFISVVTQLDSTFLSGYWYKVWHFEGTERNGYFHDSVRYTAFNVIEEIGSTNGTLYGVNPYSVSAFSQQLECFNNSTGITGALSRPVLAYGLNYTSRYDNDTTCADFYAHPPVTAVVLPGVGVRELSKAGSYVLVAPDPVNTTSKLILAGISSGYVTVVNALGQQVFAASFSHQEQIAIGDKITAPGIYYYRVTDTGGSVYTGSFVY